MSSKKKKTQNKTKNKQNKAHKTINQIRSLLKRLVLLFCLVVLIIFGLLICFFLYFAIEGNGLLVFLILFSLLLETVWDTFVDFIGIMSSRFNLWSLRICSLPRAQGPQHQSSGAQSFLQQLHSNANPSHFKNSSCVDSGPNPGLDDKNRMQALKCNQQGSCCLAICKRKDPFQNQWHQFTPASTFLLKRKFGQVVWGLGWSSLMTTRSRFSGQLDSCPISMLGN